MSHPFSFIPDYVPYITATTLTSTPLKAPVAIATFGLNDTFFHFPYRRLRPRRNLEEEKVYLWNALLQHLKVKGQVLFTTVFNPLYRVGTQHVCITCGSLQFPGELHWS